MLLGSDLDLVQRIQRGDRAALADLYARYLPYVWRYVQGQLRSDPEAARDTVSETFLAAIRSIGGFDESSGSVSGWLMGIARHKLADGCRERRREAAIDATAATRQSAEPDPAVAADQAETRVRVVRAMHRLADEDRLLLEWKYVDDLSVREIANRLGRTEKAVEAQVYRARLSFRRFWSNHSDRPGRRGDRLWPRQ